MDQKLYIGDSVYAEFDGFAVTLTTENGMGPSNTIVLERSVMDNLQRIWEAWQAERASGGDE